MKPIEISAGGRSGTYEVQGGLITVYDKVTGRKKTTQIGASSPETLARIMLREIMLGWQRGEMS